MILFIHGFASCGLGNKSRTLQAHFGADQVLAPDLPASPAQAIALLESLIRDHDIDLLVGSSLGGFYADWLNGRHGIPSVLINPSTVPFETLAAYLGEQPRWCDGASFTWTEADLFELQKMFRPVPSAAERYLVLLQSGDEVLDYRLALERYRDRNVLLETGGNHRFENLDACLAEIDAFRHQPPPAAIIYRNN